jgi:hypothetical protein
MEPNYLNISQVPTRIIVFKTKGEIRTTSEKIKTSRKTDSVRTSPWQTSLHWINYMGCYGVYNYYTDYKPWIRFVGCTSKYRTMLPRHVFFGGRFRDAAAVRRWQNSEWTDECKPLSWDILMLISYAGLFYLVYPPMPLSKHQGRNDQKKCRSWMHPSWKGVVHTY